MMAQSAKEPFDSPDWIFEIKLDGYRAVTVFDVAGKPHLWSRNGLSLEQKFPAISKAVSRLKLRSTVLDGEIVAVDENGIPRFQDSRNNPQLRKILDQQNFRGPGRIHCCWPSCIFRDLPAQIIARYAPAGTPFGILRISILRV
jgi:hypothetical protein